MNKLVKAIPIFMLVGICMGIGGCMKMQPEKVNKLPQLNPKNMPVREGMQFPIKSLPTHDLWRFGKLRWI